MSWDCHCWQVVEGHGLPSLKYMSHKCDDGILRLNYSLEKFKKQALLEGSGICKQWPQPHALSKTPLPLIYPPRLLLSIATWPALLIIMTTLIATIYWVTTLYPYKMILLSLFLQMRKLYENPETLSSLLKASFVWEDARIWTQA